MALQSGKDGKIRILNLDDLSGHGRPGKLGGELYVTATPQGRLRVMTQPALWINPGDNSVWVVYTSDSGISAMKVLVDALGNPSLQPMWQHATGVTSNQILANGVVYYANGGGQSDSATGTLFALNAATGDTLWSTPLTSHHWASPIVVNGVLYNPDGRSQGRLTAYGLPVQTLTLLEAESLPMAAFTPGTSAHIADDPDESSGHGVVLEGKRAGDFLTLTVPIPKSGNYNVKMRMKNGPNRGIWQLTTGEVSRASVDQFCHWATFPEVDFGNFTFNTAGDQAFKFTVTGEECCERRLLDCPRLHQADPTSPGRNAWSHVARRLYEIAIRLWKTDIRSRVRSLPWWCARWRRKGNGASGCGLPG